MSARQRFLALVFLFRARTVWSTCTCTGMYNTFKHVFYSSRVSLVYNTNSGVDATVARTMPLIASQVYMQGRRYRNRRGPMRTMGRKLHGGRSREVAAACHDVGQQQQRRHRRAQGRRRRSQAWTRVL